MYNTNSKSTKGIQTPPQKCVSVLQLWYLYLGHRSFATSWLERLPVSDGTMNSALPESPAGEWLLSRTISSNTFGLCSWTMACTPHSTCSRSPVHTHIHTLVVGSYWLITTAALGQSDRGEAAMHQCNRVLWPPPASKVREVSCPRTQQHWWTQPVAEQTPTTVTTIVPMHTNTFTSTWLKRHGFKKTGYLGLCKDQNISTLT